MNNIFYIILILIGFFSCKPKFDPNGEYIQQDVVYAEISEDLNVQQIYVYTTFTSNELNKLGQVNNSDAVYFQDSITLEIIESDKHGNEIQSAYLNLETDNNFDSDVFDFSLNQYYQFDSSEFKISGGNSYKLKLSNLKTEKVSYSKIKCLSHFDIKEPGYDYKSYNFYRNNDLLNHTLKIESQNDDEFISNVTMTFIIATHNTFAFGGGINGYDTLRYEIINQQAFYSKKIPTIENYKLNGFQMLGFLNRSLSSVDSTQWRRFETVYFDFKLFSKEMKEYVEAEKSFNSLSQTKPNYTNIFEEGTLNKQLGVFYSSKENRRYITIDDTTIQFLDTSVTYKHLGF